jgi:hypothetical protein
MKTALWDHPAYARLVDRVDVEVERLSATLLRFRYRVEGEIERIALPPPAPPLRTDNLWRTTCFEAFIAPAEGESYRELNFSPSSQWAAYDFTAYRAGMVQAWVPAPPDIKLVLETNALELIVTISLDLDPDPWRLALSAVIEDKRGAKAFWTAGGGGGSAPDFHHPSCFVFELPPPLAA